MNEHQSMDFTDATVAAAAELLGTRRIFTLDVRDFSSLQLVYGYSKKPVEIISPKIN
jgi:predicted nucleic acid-binding protein